MPVTITSESDTEPPLGWRAASTDDYRDVSSRSQGTEGYHSNRSVPFRAVTRHHREFSVMGTIFNPAVREATKPVPDTHSAKIEYAHTHFPPIVMLLGELTANRWR